MGDLFVLSCASSLRVCLGRVFSVGLMSGGWVLSILFAGFVFRYVPTNCVWIVFMFCLMVSVVVSSGGVSRFIV